MWPQINENADGDTPMRRLTRRTLLRTTGVVAGVASFGILTRRGDAAEFVFRYANNNVAAHPMNIRLREAAEAIRQESGGRMEIQLFPNSQLGGDTDMLSQLRTGAIQMFNLSGLILATYVPVAAINGIGFAFKDYPQVWAAMDGGLGAYVRGAIAKAGLYAFDNMWDNGYRQITSSTHPINAPDDLKGFKIRVPVSPLWTSMFKSLGASPTSININEVRRGSSRARRTRCRSSTSSSSTRCRNTSPSPITCGTGSGRWPTRGPGRNCRRTCSRSWHATSTAPR
jgi:TRAP-type transport system periplasmic protein